MSLIIHPDRVENGNEKFNVLFRAHEILIDSTKRDFYDKTGEVNIENNTCESYVVSDDQLSTCYESYAGICPFSFYYNWTFSLYHYKKWLSFIPGSEFEKQEIKKSLIDGGGSIPYVMKHVPFLVEGDRPRVAAFIDGTFNGIYKISR